MSSELHSITLEDLAKAGAHYGHKASKWNPKMKLHIYASKNKTHIINLEHTLAQLEDALKVVSEVVAKGDKVLFVATKKQTVDLVKKTAMATEMPYMIRRWIGGTFTNFEVIRKRVRDLVRLEENLLAGKMTGYTKKEQLLFADEVAKGNKLFGGIKDMKELPKVVIVQDIQKDKLAIAECRKHGIILIGLADTNVDPSLVDIAIPCNDDSVGAVELVYSAFEEAINRVRPKVASKETMQGGGRSNQNQVIRRKL
jgi:small subunit ribosomal protein S2